MKEINTAQNSLANNISGIIIGYLFIRKDFNKLLGDGFSATTDASFSPGARIRFRPVLVFMGELDVGLVEEPPDVISRGSSKGLS